MKVIITGSRHWPDEALVHEALSALDAACTERGEYLTVIHGDCPTGADRHARNWCVGKRSVIEMRYPADWDRHGKAAGPIRNQAMVDAGADLVLAFPLGDSRGTVHCMTAAVKAGIRLELPGVTWQP